MRLQFFLALMCDDFQIPTEGKSLPDLYFPDLPLLLVVMVKACIFLQTPAENTMCRRDTAQNEAVLHCTRCSASGNHASLILIQTWVPACLSDFSVFLPPGPRLIK